MSYYWDMADRIDLSTMATCDVWINHAVPGRHVAGAYGVWTQVPPLGDVNLFPNITSVELAFKYKERIEARVRSPTGCRLFPDHVRTNCFYEDPLSPVQWLCAPDGSVVAFWGSKRVGRTAANLGEFFTRMAIESDLWHSDTPCPHPVLVGKAARPSILPDADPLDYPKSVRDKYLAYYYKTPATPGTNEVAPKGDSAAAVAPSPVKDSVGAGLPVGDSRSAVAAAALEPPPAASLPGLSDATKRCTVGAFRMKSRASLTDVSGALQHEVASAVALLQCGFPLTVYTLVDDPDTVYNKVTYKLIGDDSARVSRAVEPRTSRHVTYTCLEAAVEIVWYLQCYHKSAQISRLHPRSTSSDVVFDWNLPADVELPDPVRHAHYCASDYSDTAVMRSVSEYREAAHLHAAAQRRRLHSLLTHLCASFRAARAADGTALDFAALGGVV